MASVRRAASRNPDPSLSLVPTTLASRCTGYGMVHPRKWAAHHGRSLARRALNRFVRRRVAAGRLDRRHVGAASLGCALGLARRLDRTHQRPGAPRPSSTTSAARRSWSRRSWSTARCRSRRPSASATRRAASCIGEGHALVERGARLHVEHRGLEDDAHDGRDLPVRSLPRHRPVHHAGDHALEHRGLHDGALRGRCTHIVMEQYQGVAYDVVMGPLGVVRILPGCAGVRGRNFCIMDIHSARAPWPVGTAFLGVYPFESMPRRSF